MGGSKLRPGSPNHAQHSLRRRQHRSILRNPKAGEARGSLNTWQFLNPNAGVGISSPSAPGMGNCVKCVNSLNCVNRGAKLVPSQAERDVRPTTQQAKQAQQELHSRAPPRPQAPQQPQQQQENLREVERGSQVLSPALKPKLDGSNVLGLPLKDVKMAYALGKELGRGQFGITYACTDKITGEKLACKTILKRSLRNKLDMEDVQREMQIMQRLSGHPNIVELKAVYEDKQAVHLVMELCAGGELFDRIVSRGHYTEKAAASVFRTIVKIVQHCHNTGVIHRDLKPENFLLSSTEEEALLKATDFGLSVFFKPGQVFTETVGSAYYVAPEVLRKSYGPEADIWSAGVILYILLCGLPPFWAETEKGIFDAVLRGEIDFKDDPWPSISSSAKELICQMLKQRPSERITLAEIIEHPWVRPDGEASEQPLDRAVLSRMKGFTSMNKMKKIALKVIAENLSEKEIKGLRDLFKKMDTDKSGTITFEELKEGLAKQGYEVAESEVGKIMRNADVDGNGTIDYLEFISAVMHMNKMDRENHLFAAFKQFDTDNSGFISIPELEQALYRYGMVDEGMIKDIIKEVDVNKDGRIDYNEFAAMMLKADPSSAESGISRLEMPVGKPKTR